MLALIKIKHIKSGIFIVRLARLSYLFIQNPPRFFLDGLLIYILFYFTFFITIFSITISAKWTLINSLNMKEDDAHRYIENRLWIGA